MGVQPDTGNSWGVMHWNVRETCPRWCGRSGYGNKVRRKLQGKRMGTYSIFRDIINVYISMQGPDGRERPHVEYDVSVSRASIGRLSNPAHVCPIPTFTFTMQVKPLTRILAQGEGRRECLERWTTAYSPSLPPRAHWPSVTGGVTISCSGKFRPLTTFCARKARNLTLRCATVGLVQRH